MQCYTCKKPKFLLNKKSPIRIPLLLCGATHKKYKFLLNKGPSIGSLLLFVRGATRVKSKVFTRYNVILMDKKKLSFFNHIKISHIILA
jgi:hypothetical protein